MTLRLDLDDERWFFTRAMTVTYSNPTPERKAELQAKGNLGPCLVVGGAGFLGRVLVRELAARGETVRSFDRVAASLDDAGAEHLQGDVRDADAVRRACAGCRTVFHTAAVIKLLGVCAPATRREVFDINLGGTRNVVRACQLEGISRLVYTSTDSVCFDPEPVIDGDERLGYARRFIDIYAQTKVAAERLVLAADGQLGLRSVALRPAGLWGPGPGCYMIGKLMAELAAGNFVVRIGDGRAVGDNTHVRNLIEAELLAAARLVDDPDRVGGKAYFITDQEPMNLIEWFRPLVEALGYRMPRPWVPAWPLYQVAHLLEWLHRLGGPAPKLTRLEVHNVSTSFTFSTDRARRELGYRPQIGRVEGLAECVPYCRELLCRNRRST